MVNLNYKKLKNAVIVYTLLPIIVFFIGWLNIPSAIVFSLLLVAAAFFSLKKSSSEDGERTGISISRKSLVILAIIAFVWCFLGGQGGFVAQTSDHEIRNKIIADMTLKDLPVTYDGGENMLCYYIAYWTIPTSIGKLIFTVTGSEFAGLLTSNISLLIFSTIGVFITFLLTALLTCKENKPRPLLAAVIFILFSGLDIIGVVATGQLMSSTHYEWWAEYFQFSSNTTCLYWVYNQTIPVWSLILCIINEKKMKDFAFLGLLALPFGPFPFVGIVMLCFIRGAVMVFSAIKEKTVKSTLLSAVSPQNIIGIFAIVPVYALYYTANVILLNNPELGEGAEAKYTGFRLHDAITTAVANADTSGLLKFIGMYLFFIVAEIGLYAVLLIVVCKKRQRAEIIAVTASLMLIPLFQIGYSADFSMRVSIPGLVYLCIMLSRFVQNEIPDKKVENLTEFIKEKYMLIITCLALCFGGLTAVREITRQITYTVENVSRICDDPNLRFEGFDYRDEITLDDEDPDGNFFAVNYKESPFYKYFCKH